MTSGDMAHLELMVKLMARGDRMEDYYNPLTISQIANKTGQMMETGAVPSTGGGQAAGQRASAVSRPSGNAGYSNVRRYGRAQGGLASLWLK